MTYVMTILLYEKMLNPSSVLPGLPNGNGLPGVELRHTSGGLAPCNLYFPPSSQLLTNINIKLCFIYKLWN